MPELRKPLGVQQVLQIALLLLAREQLELRIDLPPVPELRKPLEVQQVLRIDRLLLVREPLELQIDLPPVQLPVLQIDPLLMAVWHRMRWVPLVHQINLVPPVLQMHLVLPDFRILELLVELQMLRLPVHQMIQLHQTLQLVQEPLQRRQLPVQEEHQTNHLREKLRELQSHRAQEHRTLQVVRLPSLYSLDYNLRISIRRKTCYYIVAWT